VNSDKTEIHLVPNNGEKTWEPKGTKHVQVLHLEDESQMTMFISSNIVKNLFPPQIGLQVLPLRHYHQIAMVKQVASIMVGILFLLKIIGHH